MLKIIGCLIEFSTSESEPKHKMIPMNQSMCIYYSFFSIDPLTLLHALSLMVVLPQTLLQVVNKVTLVVAQNTLDYEALDLYIVNVS